MVNRFLDLSRKIWLYFLASVEQPLRFPWIVWQTMFCGVHAGELLKLDRYVEWLCTANIQTVLDVGAHTGEFASAVRACLPTAMIYSFEPLADCQAKLSRRLAKHGKFQAFAVALGDTPGKIKFWRSSFLKASSALPMGDLHKSAFPWSAENTSIEVEADTLDNYLDRLKLSPKTLLKMDVQGFEHKVLRGGLRALRQIDYVLVEVALKPLYEGQASFDEIYHMLKAEGFEYAGNWEQLLSPVDSAVLQVDAMFVRTP